MKFDFEKGLFLIFILAGFVVAARIYGLTPYQLSLIDHLMFVIFVLFLATVIGFTYRLLLTRVLAWLDDNTADGSKSSAFPIMSFFGNTALTLGTLYFIMDHFGVDLLVIVTSLGLVGLAISFGAQSTLQQFFSGIGMMMTRIVKAGDIVRLGDNPTRMVVRSIGVMTTTFSSFENEEVITMPNDALATSTVTNLTGENGYYCIEVHMQFSIRDVDLDRLAVALETAVLDIDHVVTDGSLPVPHLMYYGVQAGRAQCKFLVFIDDYHHHDETYSRILRKISVVLKDSGMLPTGSTEVVIRNASSLAYAGGVDPAIKEVKE